MQGQLDKRIPIAGAKWLIGSGILALMSIAGAALYPLWANQSNPPISVSLVSVERGTIESTINESGTVELRNQVTLKSPIEGAIDQVFVQPGQRVEAGQVLMTLRYPERQTALSSQQLQIQQQELTRQRQQLTRQQQQLAQQQQQLALDRSHQRVQEAKEQLAIEERELKKLDSLLVEGAIDRQRFLEREDRVRTARIALRDAQLATQTTQITRQNARIAEEDAAAASDTATIELQRSQLEQQRIALQLQNSVIRAPADGVVLDVKVNNGDGVQFRTELLTLGDPRQEFVRLRLSTLNAAQVRVGQPARVKVIGPDPKVYPGRVQSLYPQAISAEQNKPEGGQSGPATVPASVQLDKPTHTLIPGANVNVEIILQQQRQVVTLKTEAIQRSEEKPFVWIKDREDKAQKRSIVTGLEGLVAVEITAGLQLGEQVILPPAEPALKPGTRITTDKSPGSSGRI